MPWQGWLNAFVQRGVRRVRQKPSMAFPGGLIHRRGIPVQIQNPEGQKLLDAAREQAHQRHDDAAVSRHVHPFALSASLATLSPLGQEASLPPFFHCSQAERSDGLFAISSPASPSKSPKSISRRPFSSTSSAFGIALSPFGGFAAWGWRTRAALRGGRLPFAAPPSPFAPRARPSCPDTGPRRSTPFPRGG